MGGCFSYNSSPKFTTVRVVHLNGYVENFDQPVTVSQVTGKPARHFMFTPSQLLSGTTSSKPLKPSIPLEPGNIYLLLPCSMLQAEVSSLDLATLARRLTALARNSPSNKQAAKSAPSSSLSNQHDSSPAGITLVPSRPSPSQSYGSGSWKPILDIITERSLNQRTEPDSPNHPASE